jgi:hypothetical protein
VRDHNNDVRNKGEFEEALAVLKVSVANNVIFTTRQIIDRKFH